MRPHLKIENHMCLWGFFPVNCPNQINSFWSSLFYVLEHYGWDSKSEAFTHHRWIHESFRVMSSSVWQIMLKTS